MGFEDKQFPLPSLLAWLSGSSDVVHDPDSLRHLDLARITQASQNLQRLGSGPHAIWWQNNERIVAGSIKDAPDPDLALASLQRLDEVSEIAESLSEPTELTQLIYLLGSSAFLCDLLVGNPALLRWLFKERGLFLPSDEGIATADLSEVYSIEDPDTALVKLNSSKKREMLRIGGRAALGLSSLDEEFIALSDLADLILKIVFEMLWPEELPEPAVLALGKLGGRELNYSSDIDMIFAIPLTGTPDLAVILPPVTRSLERIVEYLTRYTPEGSLYRVDLRLRPGGNRAPLVRSTQWMETYYAGQGAPWERQMLVKARICAGDLEGGEHFLELIQPFIFPTHAERDPSEEAHRLRREKRAREGPSLSTDNVKLAPGGIRDVEFVVQVLQLLYGGRLPEIRHPTTLEAISRLHRAGLLPDPEAENLTGAYRFMRRLEHILQMQEDRQTFNLPVAAARRRAIAILMGCENSTELQQLYDDHRESVLATLTDLLPGLGEGDQGEPVESLLNLPAGGEEAASRLQKRGFAQPAQSHRVLLAAGSGIRASGPNAWAAFVGLLPPLLEDAAATGAPDRALNNLERILRRLGSPGSYVRLLASETPLRRALLTLCASGDMLTDLLLRHPEHFERLFSLGAAFSATDRAEWRLRLRHLRRRSLSSRDMVSELELLRTREFLAAGLAYVTGEQDLSATMLNLGLLAHDLIRCFLGAHFQKFIAPPQVGVMSLGTLSARSMTFASDADLIFIHSGGAGAEIQTLAARVAGLLSPPGGPYQIDMRLRPEGRSAPTSVDVNYLRSYLADRASPWEALALSRIQPLYGRKAMMDEAIQVIEEWLDDFHLDVETRVLLRDVRQRQEEEAGRDATGRSEADDSFDLKRSPGGMADIEYLGLGLYLDNWKHSTIRPANIPDLFPPLVSDGVLSADEGDLLRRTYLRLRKIQLGLQLHYGRDVTRLPESWSEDNPPVALQGESASSIAEDTTGIREIFDREYPINPS